MRNKKAKEIRKQARAKTVGLPVAAYTVVRKARNPFATGSIELTPNCTRYLQQRTKRLVARGAA